MLAFILFASSTWNLTVKTTGKTYPEVRAELLKEGWTPSPLAEGRNCDVYAKMCDGRPEQDYCDLVGPIPRCEWLWIKGASQVRVKTLLDGDYVEAISTEEYP